MASKAKKNIDPQAAMQPIGDLHDLVAKRDDLSKEITVLEVRVRDLQNDVELTQKNYESVRAEIEGEIRRAQVSHRADDAEGALRKARIELEIANLEATKASAERSVDMARLQLDRAKEKSDKAQEQYQSIQNRLKEVMGILESAQKQVQTVEGELSRKQEMVRAQDELYRNLQRDTESTLGRVGSLAADIEKLEGVLKEKVSALEGIKQNLVTAEQYKLQLNDENSEAREQLASARTAKAELDESLLAAKEARERELSEYAIKIEEAKHLHEAQILEHSETLKRLKAELDSSLEKQRDEGLALNAALVAEQSKAGLAAAKAEADDMLGRAAQLAEETRNQATADYKVAVAEAIAAKTEAEGLKTKAAAERQTLIDEAAAMAQSTLEDARKGAKELLQEAETESARLVGSVQADYDQRMAEGDRLIEAKRAEVETASQELLQEAQRRARETLGKAQAEADGINGEVDRIKRKAQADALGVIEKAKADTDVMKTKTDTYLQSLKKKADEEYDVKRREMDSKIEAYKASKEADVRKWEQEQMESIRASRKRHVDEAARTVVQLVQKQLASNTKVSMKADDAAELYGEIERNVRSILNNDNAAAKEKLKKLMADPGVKAKTGGFKLTKDMLIAIGVGAAILLIIGGMLWYQQNGRSANGSDSYVAKMGEERRAAKVYNPPMSADYKSTYTDNVMFTTGYVKTELDTQYQDKWIVSLNRFVVHKLDMDDRIIVTLVPLETGLLRKLEKMRAQVSPATEKTYIQKMREAEEETLGKMERVLGGPKNLQLYLKHKRTFYEENVPK